MSRVVGVLLCLMVAACGQGGAQDKKGATGKGAPQGPVPVTTLEVAPKPVPVSFDAVGRTEGSRDVQVRADAARRNRKGPPGPQLGVETQVRN